MNIAPIAPHKPNSYGFGQHAFHTHTPPVFQKPVPSKPAFASIPARTYQTLHPSILFAAQSASQDAKAFEPSLAAEVSFQTLKFPVYISPKMDGNRGYVMNNQIISRGGMPIPNLRVQQILSRPELEGMDGELLASKPNDPNAITKAGKFFRAAEPKGKTQAFQFRVFDLWNEPGKTFTERQVLLKKRLAQLPPDLKKYVKSVPQVLVHNKEDLLKKEQEWLDADYEGVVIRNPDALYLNGRSDSEADQSFLKLKRYVDAEAQIVGFNPFNLKLKADRDLLAELVKEGMITPEQAKLITPENPILARYKVHELETGIDFNLGPGALNYEQRRLLWQTQDTLLGQVVKYKHFPRGANPETKKPRHASLLAFREEHDMPANLREIAERIRRTLKNYNDD